MHDDERDQRLGRREFTSTALMALLAGVTVTVSGCSSDSPMAPSTPGGNGSSDGDRVGAVSDNHGHTATITGAQASAGQGFTLDIRGTSDHPHTVQITAAELSQIIGGQRVSKGSSSDQSNAYGPHSHVVTFN